MAHHLHNTWINLGDNLKHVCNAHCPFDCIDSLPTSFVANPPCCCHKRRLLQGFSRKSLAVSSDFIVTYWSYIVCPGDDSC
mmetsp:Transcript_2124/g.4797  ORF Transcript_2124/g.4797 Transcript_2124/m.4797 type:complete len:81 (+) Transcript_2124:267-509(+)